MDSLYDKLISEDNLRLAVDFSLLDLNQEIYYNPIQVEHCRVNKDLYVEIIKKKLYDYKNYKPQTAIRCIKKKNEFAIRNLIVLDIEDVIIRTAMAIVIANELESKLIDNCFSSRRGDQLMKNYRLTENFATISWHKFCEWQADSINKYHLLLKTDISSFFDSISHKHQVNALMQEFNLTRDNPIVVLMKSALKVLHVYRSVDAPIEIEHGITIGASCNHIFANLLLNKIDNFMMTLPNISYGRYVDDMRIFSNSKVHIESALIQLQMKLFELGLNINGAKTRYAGKKELLSKLISENLFSYLPVVEEGKMIFPSPSKMINIQNNYVAYKKSTMKDLDKPLSNHCEDIRAWNGIKLFGYPEKIAAYCHTVNHVIEKKPEELTNQVISKLFRIICESPHNEKFACWLIFRIIIDGRFEKSSRAKLIERVLDLIIHKKATSYVRMRFLINFSKQVALKNYDFSILNELLATTLHKKFTQAIDTCYHNKSIISILTAMYASKIFNDWHNSELYIELKNSEEKSLNDVVEQNFALLLELPNLSYDTIVDQESDILLSLSY